MFRKTTLYSVTSCLLFALAGCGGPATTTMQGVAIELPPSKEVLRDTHDRFETREYKVTIHSSNLTINGTSYGSVQQGDKVKVGTDSTVTVNGTTRASK